MHLEHWNITQLESSFQPQVGSFQMTDDGGIAQKLKAWTWNQTQVQVFSGSRPHEMPCVSISLYWNLGVVIEDTGVGTVGGIKWGFRMLPRIVILMMTVYSEWKIKSFYKNASQAERNFWSLKKSRVFKNKVWKNGVKKRKLLLINESQIWHVEGMTELEKD